MHTLGGKDALAALDSNPGHDALRCAKVRKQAMMHRATVTTGHISYHAKPYKHGVCARTARRASAVNSAKSWKPVKRAT